MTRPSAQAFDAPARCCYRCHHWSRSRLKNKFDLFQGFLLSCSIALLGQRLEKRAPNSSYLATLDDLIVDLVMVSCAHRRTVTQLTRENLDQSGHGTPRHMEA
uniref:Transposase n=1 Tax=Mycobacterium leprae TaxID=1769 RepID=O05753_MYCLR|nr:unknown [Mycobacterium leprae]